MSAVSDIANREAALAEAELSEAEAELLDELMSAGGPFEESLAMILAEREPEPEPEPELAVAAPPSGEPTEKQLREFGKETVRHLDAVRRIMGPFAEGMEECENCAGVGLAPPGPQPQTHPYFKECPTCVGFGLVLTGSSRPGNESRDCPACLGRGFLEQLDESGAPLAGAGAHAAAPAPVIAAPPASPPAELTQNGNAEPRFGVPAWMGDTNLGQ